MSRRRKALPKTPVEAVVDSLSHDGRGVAHIDGKAVFIDGALPQEKVTFIYTAKRRKFDEGKVESVLRSSPDRDEARCSHYGVCGGCSLQHLKPQAQLASKQNILVDNLERIGQVQAEELLEPLQADIWAYRTKARLGVRYVPKKGKVLVGFREKRNSFVTDTQQCEVLHAKVGKKINALSLLIESLTVKDQVPQIEVAIGDTVYCLIFRVLEHLSTDDKSQLIEFGEQHGFQIWVQPNKPEAMYSLWGGEQQLSYAIDDGNIEVLFQPQDFTQVNPSVNRLMVEQALALLSITNTDRILDLFCGLGNFTLPMARRAAFVVGVEGDEEMVARARKNAAHNGVENVDFFTANLFEGQSDTAWGKQTFDKVLIDPPRSGAQEIIPLIAALAPGVIVYVSCNPGTLARDAGILVQEHGYRLEKAGIMDMFPHTAHVESIAVFRK